MAHKAKVRQISAKELISYQTARIDEWRASGRYQDDEALISKVNEELEVFDHEGAWDCKCDCGWAGNNPYPSKASAVEALEYHYERAKVDEQRAKDVARAKGEVV